MFVRVGELDGKIYLDLCDLEWRAVEIDKTGWRVVDRPAVRFRRSPDMRPLPEPEGDGSVDGLRPLLNIPGTRRRRAQTAATTTSSWRSPMMLACLRGRGPYPVMAIGGEQGSAKSTRSAMLRSVVDPRHPRAARLPRDERDLVVAARNQHVLAFDNVSGLRHVAVGRPLPHRLRGRVRHPRALHRRGRGRVLGRPADHPQRHRRGRRAAGPRRALDLLDLRADQPARTGSRRKRSGRPSTLRMRLSSAPCSTRSRRASSAFPRSGRRICRAWPTSLTGRSPASRRCGRTATFSDAYNANILGAVESVLEASPVAVAVRELMANLAKALQDEVERDRQRPSRSKLTDLVTERIAKSDDWPRNGRALSGRLRRAASFLRRVGIDVVFNGKGTRRRV